MSLPKPPWHNDDEIIDMPYKDRRLNIQLLRVHLSEQIAKAADEYHNIMRSGVFHCAQTGLDWKVSLYRCNESIEKMLMEIGKVNDMVNNIDRYERPEHLKGDR